MPTSSSGVATRSPREGAVETAQLDAVRGRSVIDRVRDFARDSALTVGVALAVGALALDSGGYDVTTRNCFAIAVWWAIGVGVASSVWPVARIPRAALVGGAGLTALVTMTAIWVPWADSAERAFTEFNRLAFYLGVFTLVVIGSNRRNAARWADGVALAIGAIAIVGLISRLFPDLWGDRGVSSFFPGGTRYLGYPLDYWNGLGIFIGLGLPLMLRMAAEARTAVARALAIAPFPAVLGALYLTSSRGGFVTAAVAMVVFFALATDRLRLLVAAACAGAGSAAAILVLDARSELADGILTSDVIHSQGRSAALLIGVICVLTGLAYGFVSRFEIRAPRLGVPRAAVVAGAIVLVAAGIVAANPSQRFEDFKQEPSNPFAATAGNSGAGSGASDSASSEGSVIDSASSHLLSSGGNGRWQFWGAAVDEFETKPIAGRGPGSFEAWWAQHGSISYFTRHAHSHYLQTLGELGAIGLLLLLVFLLAPVAALFGRLRDRTPRERNLIAASAGLLAGFLVALGLDWIWELPAVAVVGVIAIALLVGPATSARAEAPQAARNRSRFVPLAARGAVVVVALAVIAGQAIPLLAQDDLEVSKDRFAAADLDGARDAALEARDVQPWAASPHLQLALVEEAMGDLPAARDAASEAIERDPLDWRLWLTRARIDEASGLSAEAEADLARAVELNPRSPLFANR